MTPPLTGNLIGNGKGKRTGLGAYAWVRGNRAMARVFTRRRRPLPKWKRRLIAGVAVILIVLLALSLALSIVERNIEPVLTAYAESRVKQVAADAVREALKEQIVSQKEFEDLIQFVRNEEGEVQGVVIDQHKQAQLHEDTITHIQKYLQDGMYRRMQEQDLDKMEIYLGQAFKSRIFADRGPRIPVTLVPSGAVKVDLNPTMEAAGINNVLVNLMLNIKLDISVVVPFPTDPITVSTHYPLATALVVGDTPEWYWNTSGSAGQMPIIPGMTPDSALEDEALEFRPDN